LTSRGTSERLIYELIVHTNETKSEHVMALTYRVFGFEDLSFAVLPAVVDARFVPRPHSIELEFGASLPLHPRRRSGMCSLRLCIVGSLRNLRGQQGWR
jgi:hypothetical protein